MTQAEALYHLQEIELDITRHQKRLDEMALALNNSAVVTAAREQLTAAQQILSPLRTKMRDLELEIQSNLQKTRATEQQLYGGSVKNPKTLQEMQQEIESLKKWHAELENRLLESMVAVEDAEAVLADSQENLTQVTAAWESEHQDLLAEQAQLEQLMTTLNEQRKEALKAVSPESLKLYTSLKPRRANQPLALMVGKSCSVCGIEQTMALAQEVRQGHKLIPCVSCGRILVPR